MPEFICAYFGKDWTITARGFSSAKQAEKHGLFMMPTAGVFGFAVIAQDDKMWTLRDDFSVLSGKETITQTDLNNFAISF
ncbi:hypothetical protein CMO86_10015 [Candidatus Woesearchaeota archaeon]|nr:hypothetical protein [Candidatus Woesearchaeota archaeon]